MKRLICGLVCGASLVASNASFAWGAFSRWTTVPRDQSDSICHAIRSTLSTRTGLAYVVNFQSSGWHTLAYAENVTGRTKGADLWLQTANARGGTMGPEKQGFNIVPGATISLDTSTPIPTTMARCAVQ